jgi:hypothetical protein
MNRVEYAEYFANVLDGLAQTTLALNADGQGPKSKIFSVALTDEGLSITLPWELDEVDQSDASKPSCPWAHGSEAPQRLPLEDTILGKTRGGRLVTARELVDALRDGWQGFKVLCDKTKFDVHSDQLTGWLKRCIGLGLVVKDGRAYAVRPSATLPKEVA